MAPPPYNDLGKDAKDLFDKDYKFGLLNFDFKSRTSNNVDCKLNALHDISRSALSSFVEAKAKLAPQLNGKIKIDSKLSLLNELELSDAVAVGAKHTLCTTLQPDVGVKGLVLKNNYKNDLTNSNVDMDFKTRYPSTTLNTAFRCPDYPFLGGLSVNVDTFSMKATKYAGALAYKTGDLQVTGMLNNSKIADLSILHLASVADVGIRMSYNHEKSVVGCGIGFQKNLDKTKFIKGKVDLDSSVGLAFGAKVADGVTVILSSLVDGKDLSKGNHKIGLSVEISA